ADSPGTDVAEFIELYNASSDPVSLGGVVLVLFNGSNDTVYSALDLSAHTIPANGFFLIGSTGMANADIQLAPGGSGWLQNGQDAVALYFGSPANFALNTTFVTDVTNTLIDALVYDTADPDDIDLLNSLTPGGVQVDEAGAGNSANHAIARVPDGGAAFDTASYVLQAPTPGTTNQIAPVIRTQPAASTIDGGNTASMSVAALGGQLSYQWYQGAAGTTTTPVGTNSATLVTPALNATSSFWVRVSNPYGSVDSTAAVVTVNTVAQPPLITTQPASSTIQSGATTVLTVGADGQGQSLTFAWYQGASGNTSVPVGTNSASFTTPALTQTTSYWVRVTSAGGSVDSSAATVTVETPVPSAVIASFTASPTTIDAGGSSTLSWSVTGAASLSINNGVGNVTGSTSTSVSPTSTTTYTLTATNSANESVTATVTVTVNTTTEDHPAFKVTSIDITGTQLSLTWESQPGAGYIVEVSDNPADAQSWAPLLSSVSSQGASTAVAADLANTAYAGSAKLFFRVKVAAP
ncbi:MAG: lamin tail domain-containing protein, partial [Verrucomicrobia bacterium]|nr:lamin tail domain-containing protein [Verrucomicrobiota bacterium]